MEQYNGMECKKYIGKQLPILKTKYRGKYFVKVNQDI